MIFYDSASQLPTSTGNGLQINQYNRKSSIEAKLGMQGFNSVGVSSDVSGGNAAVVDAFAKPRDSINKVQKRQRGNS